MKVLVPDVPTADELLPYLRRIDESKWYSNGGPLVRELEGRIGGVTVASATLGLELAAPIAFKKKYVRIPAFTFVATATALLRAGMEPVLCDVGPDWALKDIDDQSLPVCPFGVPVSPSALVDAASAWGNGQTGNRVHSFHATKSLPAGEGGAVCGDPELVERVRKLANFGLETTAFAHGVVNEPGTNAKLSEYHAAVALAALDKWPATVAWRNNLESMYRRRVRVPMQARGGGVYTAFPVLVPNAASVARHMAEQGIETRRWYTPTLDRHPAFQGLAIEGDLKNCRILNDSILCLPYHRGVTKHQVNRVCEVLEWSITKSAKGLSSTKQQTSLETFESAGEVGSMLM